MPEQYAQLAQHLLSLVVELHIFFSCPPEQHIFKVELYKTCFDKVEADLHSWCMADPVFNSLSNQNIAPMAGLKCCSNHNLFIFIGPVGRNCPLKTAAELYLFNYLQALPGKCLGRCNTGRKAILSLG